MAVKRWKMRICLMFRSCKSKHHIMNDVVHEPPPSRHYHHYCQFIQLLSPKPNPFNFSLMEDDQTKQLYSLKETDHQMQGGKCPPASPIVSPLYHSSSKFHSQKDKSRNPTSRKQRVRNYNKKYYCNFEDHFPDCNYNSLFGSIEEDEDNSTTLFSSESSHQYSLPRQNKSSSTSRRRRAVSERIVEDSLAVVKQSSDPYSDFKTSMVEMIVENQIFGAKDLQNLLQCFLSLNSRHHHKVIVQVFTEILEILFSS